MCSHSIRLVRTACYSATVCLLHVTAVSSSMRYCQNTNMCQSTTQLSTGSTMVIVCCKHGSMLFVSHRGKGYGSMKSTPEHLSVRVSVQCAQLTALMTSLLSALLLSVADTKDGLMRGSWALQNGVVAGWYLMTIVSMMNSRRSGEFSDRSRGTARVRFLATAAVPLTCMMSHLHHQARWDHRQLRSFTSQRRQRSHLRACGTCAMSSLFTHHALILSKAQVYSRSRGAYPNARSIQQRIDHVRLDGSCLCRRPRFPSPGAKMRK